MFVESFYQADNNLPSIPITLITPELWQAKTSPLTEVERQFLAEQQFKGELGNLGLIYDAKGHLIKVYLGSGSHETKALAAAALNLPAACYHLTQPLSEAALMSWSLAQYRFNRYKKQALKPKILSLSSEEMATICAKAKAIFLIRDLINMPANALGPKELAEVAKTLAEQHKAQYQEWVDEDLIKDNFPAIHAVGRSAANRPRLISFRWGQEGHPRVTLVGKGVCFDSGGLDIKTSHNMRIMKKDMGGAAHVLGLADWIMTEKLALRLEVYIPAVENLVGPDAYRPGDVLTMRSGLTVEVENTDAEGRLVLADALSKAQESSPELIIDFATLTGAARIAVGTEIAAMFTNDDLLAKELMESSELTQDPIWRLPLYEPYTGLLDSSVADLMSACNSPYAGAITAALFLKHFILPSSTWVHFDMMAWNEKSKPGKPEGGEAMAIRALTHYLQQKYGKKR